jgi:superfamily II DNA helicase RecQ
LKFNDDILVVLAPGFGKSAIYQYLAYVGCGLTLVIEPLICIIEDQYKISQELKIPVAASFAYNKV